MAFSMSNQNAADSSLPEEPKQSKRKFLMKWKRRGASRRVHQMGSAASLKRSLILPMPIAETEYGTLQGRHYTLSDGRVTNVFLGVPFAKPPVGKLRFQKPQPPEPWTGVLSATAYKHKSIQKDFPWDKIDVRVKKSEDCLYLNVMAPAWSESESGGVRTTESRTRSQHADSSASTSTSTSTSSTSSGPDTNSSTANFPVMVYVHGGGFIMDCAAKYHYRKICENIVSKGVVFVTIQYRLGFLGFLTTNDDVAPGNNGLWDQCMALHWVKRNIAQFGGDPDNITLLGQSAGAVSCDLLSLSPHTRDLFDKVILMAGNAETIWSVSPRCRVALTCRKKAMELGFRKPSADAHWSTAENEALVHFLNAVAPERLGLTMVGCTDIFESLQLPVTPVIDGDFLPKSLTELRREAPAKTVIAGECQYEGLLFFALGLKRANKQLLRFVRERATNIVREGSVITGVHNFSLSDWEQAYGITADSLQRKVQKENLVAVISDAVNSISLHTLCQRLTAGGSKVFAYNFQHYNAHAMQGINLYMPFYGATHCSDINALFDINMFVTPFVRTAKDRKMTNVLASLFVNFARCGDPNGDSQRPSVLPLEFHWQPLGPENLLRHLVIKADPVMRERKEHEQRIQRQSPLYAAVHEMMTLASEEEYMSFARRTKLEP